MASSIACFAAFARYGDNGTGSSFPLAEYGIADSSAIEIVTGQRAWSGGNTSTAFDSGWVAVELSANAGGGASAIGWTVTGGVTVPLATTSISYGTIEKVEVYAAARNGKLRMAFRSIIIDFYVGTNRKQRVVLGSSAWPDANTLGQTGVSTDMTSTTVPTRSDIDKVIITADVRMQADQGVTPLFDEIIGEVRVFSSSCNP